MSRGRSRNKNQFSARTSGPGAGSRGHDYDPTRRFGDTVKVVKVPYATSNSGVSMSAPITILRAPWETNEIAPAGGVQDESS